MIRLQDLGELGYGGAVTGLTAWDDKRITEATLTEKDIIKRYSFWGYLVPGAACLLANAVGWGRRWEPWTERVTHGFIYGFPAFVKDVYERTKEEGAGARGGTKNTAAVNEARALLAEAKKRELNAGIAVGSVTPGIYVEEEQILS